MKETIKKIAEDAGVRFGVAPVKRMGKKPSMDPNYLLPGAKSIISFACPINGDVIRRYLGKEDHGGYANEEAAVFRRLFETAGKVAEFLESEGFRAVVVMPNGDYRYLNENPAPPIPQSVLKKFLEWLSSKSGARMTSVKRSIVNRFYPLAFGGVDWSLTPTFSHRYGAVAAGLGAIGWGGNVFVPGLGSRVLLETVITDAVIDPDPMLEESPCDGCRICAKVCQAGFIDMKEKDEVEIGGRTFTHNKKGSNIRCTLVCAGFSGQNLYDGWSTWSPGRVRLPNTDDNIKEFFDKFILDNMWRPNWYAHVLKNLALATEQGYMEEPKERLTATCGNCQLVCWGDRKEREYNYNLLTGSGEVVEGENFSFEVVRGV